MLPQQYPRTCLADGLEAAAADAEEMAREHARQDDTFTRAAQEYPGRVEFASEAVANRRIAHALKDHAVRMRERARIARAHDEAVALELAATSDDTTKRRIVSIRPERWYDRLWRVFRP